MVDFTGVVLALLESIFMIGFVRYIYLYQAYKEAKKEEVQEQKEEVQKIKSQEKKMRKKEQEELKKENDSKTKSKKQRDVKIEEGE